MQSAEPDVRKSPEGKKSSDLMVEVWPRNVRITVCEHKKEKISLANYKVYVMKFMLYKMI